MSRFDVRVLGAGPAALAVASRLARGGASVALVASGSHGANPRAMVGFADGPHRLALGLGDEVTRELMAFALRGRELLWELGVGRRTGGLHASMGSREEGEAEGAVEAHVGCGDPAELREGAGIFGPGRFVPGDGVVPVDELLAALRERALAAGVVEAEGDAEVTVLAGDWSQRDTTPFLADALWPVRQLSLTLAGGERFEHAIRAQWGYLAAHWAEHLVVSGARWATPHLEVGETSLEVEPRVRAKLHEWAGRAFGAGEVLAEGVRIETHSCDGLPLIGPLPGDPTTLLLTGFGRDELVLSLAAAEAVAGGLLEEPVPLPSLLRPHRLV